jgi:membrane protease YdiL (CAAX protease family)
VTAGLRFWEIKQRERRKTPPRAWLESPRRTDCATSRKAAQKVVRQLEIRCSIRLSYGRRRGDIYRVFPVADHDRTRPATKFCVTRLRDLSHLRSPELFEAARPDNSLTAANSQSGEHRLYSPLSILIWAIMKRFTLGILGFVVVWVIGLAPQFLAYAHVSGIIIFALEGGVSIAGYLLYVRLIEKRSALELSRFRIALLPVGLLVGMFWFSLLMAMLYAGGHYQINGVAFPNRWFSAIVFALGTAIWEEVTFRGLLFRVTEQTFGTWVGVAVSAIAFGALHGLNPNASLAASIAIILESGILLAAAYFATRTLWLPIGLHFGWNFAEDFIFGVRMSGHAARPAVIDGTLTGSSLWTGGLYGLEASIWAIGMAAVVSAIFIAIAIRNREIVPFMPNRKRRFAAAVS